MLGACSRPPAGFDLAPIGEKAAQKFGPLVVYDISLVGAKGTYLATWDEPPFSATTGSLAPTP